MNEPAAQASRSQSLHLVLAVLLVVYIFNFLDRQIVNILAEPIRRDLGLSDTQIGLMTGIAFAAFYTFLGIPIARFADKPSTNRVGLIAGALVIWSAMTALCGQAQSFLQLLLARIGVGVGEAGCSPAAHSLIADLAPPEKRASAMANYALGIPVGTLLGMLIGGLLADSWGWRMAFVVVGLPGILLAAVVLLLLRDPRCAKALRSAPSPHLPRTLSNREALAEILGSRAYVLVVAAGSAAAFLSYGKATWTTIFFQRTHGLSAGETGFWFGIWGGIAAIVGTFSGGWLADRFGKVNRQHVLTAPAIGFAVAVPLAIASYVMTDWRWALALLMIPTLLNSLYYGPCFSSAQGLVKPEARAMASAVLLFSQNLIGLGLGPLFFGMLSDWIKPVAGDESVRWVLYGAAVIGFVPAFFFWRASLRLNEELDRKGP
ncbi:MFS transporter [Novosphingobium sp. AAP93]|uniref:spinster family MFS transporter n=1 Tax=Novosphingobium sp. AAP93 TaxID=1523427 RepID=UPI0006B95B98|nr:MFS transporter [Novosphingobium sp. AAP93]KPF86609.1 MFS transporter [Novosphingobium sp. AAP93]